MESLSLSFLSHAHLNSTWSKLSNNPQGLETLSFFSSLFSQGQFSSFFFSIALDQNLFLALFSPLPSLLLSRLKVLLFRYLLLPCLSFFHYHRISLIALTQGPPLRILDLSLPLLRFVLSYIPPFSSHNPGPRTNCLAISHNTLKTSLRTKSNHIASPLSFGDCRFFSCSKSCFRRLPAN